MFKQYIHCDTPAWKRELNKVRKQAKKSKRYISSKQGLWRKQALKAKNPLENAMKRLLESLGIDFTYQAIIGRYRVDFLVPSRAVIIETDGQQHQDEKAKTYDMLRDAWLSAQGYKVVRFPSRVVFDNPQAVKHQLASLLVS